MAPEHTTVSIQNRIMRLSNLDKVLWPKSAYTNAEYTKADLVQYYAEIAPALLPHVKNRPLTLTRYPDGVEGKHFYQKNAPEYTPDWIRTFRVDGDDGSVQFLLADESAALVWLANQACIGIHPWLSTIDHPTYPDQMVIDLDPNPPAGFNEARRIAFVVRDVLEKMDLRGYPKVSGATGVHIYVPIIPQFPFEAVRELAKFIAQTISRLLPEEATNERRTHARGARVYIDHLQNVRGQTMAAPYSVRPRPGATVSTPVTWTELADCQPEAFTIKTVPRRLEQLGDLFAPVLTDRQHIGPWLTEIGAGLSRQKTGIKG